MKKAYFIGLDFGTQGLRCGVIDENGHIAASCEAKYDTVYPSPGRAEQQPLRWLSALFEAVGHCRSSVGEAVFSSIKALSVCATASTVIAVDSDGNPIGDAIMWMDIRAVKEADAINALGHEVLKYCGGEVSVEWFVPKMLWLKNNAPDVFGSAYKIVEQQDYVNHYLTGQWCSCVCHAACKENYVEELGGFVPGFYEEIGLPEFFDLANVNILKQGEPVGKIRAIVAEELGLNKELIVYQGSIDAYANMVGLGVCRPGETGIVMGSSFVHLAMMDRPLFKDGTWGPYKDAILPGSYCMEGGQISAGSITKWFLREFDVEGENPYMVMAEEAERIPAGSEGVIALDFFQGNRTPYKDPLSKGVFYGLALSHTRAHMYRAVLESIAFGTRNILESMSGDGAEINEMRGCGGVVNNPMWLKIIADVAGKPMILTENSGAAGVLGCAIMAAVGSGDYDTFVQACDSMVHTSRIVEPDIDAHGSYVRPYQKYLELYSSLKHMMHEGE